MKACAAVFGIVLGVIAVASPIRNSSRCEAAEGAPGPGRESTSRSSSLGASLQHPPEARLFDNLTRWRYRSGAQHLSCEDVCKKEPKLFQVFEMTTPLSSAPDDDDKVRALAKKVEQILDADGWNKCKSIDTESGTFFNTYSKDGRLLEVRQSYSNGVGDSLGITIAEQEMKPTAPLPPNVPVSITAEWKTYRNVPLGFEISYPPDWGVERVAAGYGAVRSIGDCYQENCLIMRLATDEYEGDAFQIAISPEKIYTGEPCLPGTTRGGTVKFTPSGQPYSSCVVSTAPPRKPSTDYAIGPYPTWADRGEFSIFETCDRRLTLWTTVGDYRYQFTPEGSMLLPNSFEMKDVYRKILSTVKVTPVRLGTVADRPAPPVR